MSNWLATYSGIPSSEGRLDLNIPGGKLPYTIAHRESDYSAPIVNLPTSQIRMPGGMTLQNVCLLSIAISMHETSYLATSSLSA